MALVRQVQVMTATEGRAVAAVSVNGVAMVPVYVRYEGSVQTILERE